MIEDDSHGETTASMLEFLEGFLSNKSEMVIYEAARALVSLPQATQREISRAVSGALLRRMSSV